MIRIGFYYSETISKIFKYSGAIIALIFDKKIQKESFLYD